MTRKALLAWPGLTGARFDLLSALLHTEYRRPSCIELRRSELRRKLGVSAAVVSRMVRALLERGWVARRRDKDRRTWTLCYLDAIRYSFADRATLEYLWWPSPFDH
ncbi:MAG TPA: helix-turn-helix domain-containing protein [Polyangiaceae bacterium]|nr:helix-turn-helix domain-containing protein [Polyangiaceae bacterium]